MALELVRLTKDAAFCRPGWKKVIGEVMSCPGGRRELEELLDRLAKDTDPRLAAGRNHDVIAKPAAFASSELKRIQKTVMGS